MGNRNPHQDCLSAQTTKWVLSRSRRYLRFNKRHLYKQGFEEPEFPPGLENPWRKNDLRTAVALSSYDHGWNVWNYQSKGIEKCTNSILKLCEWWRDTNFTIVQFLEQWLQGLWDRIRIESILLSFCFCFIGIHVCQVLLGLFDMVSVVMTISSDFLMICQARTSFSP